MKYQMSSRTFVLMLVCVRVRACICLESSQNLSELSKLSEVQRNGC